MRNVGFVNGLWRLHKKYVVATDINIFTSTLTQHGAQLNGVNRANTQRDS